jgi:hypothetical protein
MEPTPDLTTFQLQDALHHFGAYRIHRVGEVLAGLENSRNVTQAQVLALGLRESFLRNVEGGAKMVDGRWVKQDDPKLMDVGPFQISRWWHRDALQKMPAVEVGTWKPVQVAHTAYDGGYAPQFEDSVNYAVNELVASVAWAKAQGIKKTDRVRLAIAAHNAGRGGALSGYRKGDVDLLTARQDYSAWVLRHAARVDQWLDAKPGRRSA